MAHTPIPDLPADRDVDAARPSTPEPPPEAWEPLLRLARLASRPLERFLRIEAASGIALLASAVLALVWANSPLADSYTALWHTPLGVRVGPWAFERTLEWAINDGLMVVFFFVVALEIRRELHHGELSEWRRAALPAFAALGGMIAPALLYLVVAGAVAPRGWGVPTATDIAFAVGALALLGKRVPPALRVLLLALAVIDDLGAIVVIAVFYSGGVQWAGLVVAALAFAAVVVLQRFGVRSRLAYAVPGLVAWAGVTASGVHPTIAGVVLGLLTPVRAWLGPAGFTSVVRARLDRLSTHPDEVGAALHDVEVARREALSPAESAIITLHPWVAFGIMPLFALANAGVSLGGLDVGDQGATVALAVAVGLVVGKPVGVLLASLLAVRLRVATLPAGLGARHLVVLGIVAGVGFTMALFVAHLAFDPHGGNLGAAKLGVMAASALAGVAAFLVGRALLPSAPLAGSAATVDEAESSTEK